MTYAQDRDARVQALVDRTSLTREEAEEIVAIALGESGGDIVPVPPLSPEERRRIGLGLTLEEARERMREAACNPPPLEPPVVAALDPEERAAVIALLLASTNVPPEEVDEEIDVYPRGGERVNGRLVLPNERRLIGRLISQALEELQVRTEPAPAAPSGAEPAVAR